MLIANSNLVPDWANWEEFRRLEHMGLTMYGQMTAGSWIYIGTQGILQGTYETLGALARQHFGEHGAGAVHAVAFADALAAGVEVIAYDCALSPRAVALGDFHDFRQGRDVAAHAEHAVHRHQAGAVGLRQLAETLAAVETGLAALRGAPADAAVRPPRRAQDAIAAST